MKRNYILKEAGVLLIAITVILSSIAAMANTDNDQTLENMFSKLGEDHTPQLQTKMEETIQSTAWARDTILFESFEDTWVADSDGDLAPPGWENHITNPGDTGSPYYLPWHWGQYGTVTSYDPPAVPPDGDYQAMVQWDYNHQDEWLITPLINLADYTGCELTFWRFGHIGSTYLDHYYVKVSPTGGYDKADFTDELWDASALPEGDNHYDYPYDISLSAYDGTSIRIAWQNVDGDGQGLWWGSCIDAVEVTGETGVDPLIADADGPYEADEGEPIQFEGSATGGVLPYSFHWAFGNGDTSEEEDPIYTYDDPGVYQVLLTVTDNASSTDDDDTTATINEKPCCFEVEILPGFGIGLKAEVTEICNESHTGVPWEFNITGGIIVIPISPLTGTEDFTAGETKIIKALLVLGIGSIQITFTIDDCDPREVNAFIIGPFVIVR